MAERIDNVLGKKLASSADLSANFESDIHWNKSASLIGIWVDATSVTDNTGTFEVYIRANTSSADSDESNWHVLGVSPPLVLADTSEVLYGQLTLPPCEFKVVFTSDGGTPDGSANVWLSSGSLGGGI